MPSAAVWGRFLQLAVLWLIPALFVLPFYLVLVAASAAFGDGELLGVTEGLRGGINAALGPLLIACAGVGGWVVYTYALTAEDYVYGAIAVVVAALLGLVCIRTVLRHMQAKVDGP